MTGKHSRDKGKRGNLITGRTAKLNDDAKPKRRHKYGAKRTTVGQHTFDSKAEAERYKELLILARANLITGLELQPVFMLQESFMHDGKRIRSIKYVADFKYVTSLPNGQVVVEDVKGVQLPVFRLKRKLFLKRFPDIELRIVRRGGG